MIQNKKQSKTLPAIDVEQSLYLEIEKRIRDLLRDKLYQPLFDLVSGNKKEKLANAPQSALVEAIRSGRMAFHQGQFIGQVNAAIAKELREIGAKYDRSTKSYRILKSDLASQYILEINSSLDFHTRQMELINKRLDKINPTEITRALDIDDILDSLFESIDEKVSKSVGVEVDLTKKQLSNLRKEYQLDTGRKIKKFIIGETKTMREDIQSMVLSGQRPEAFTKLLDQKYIQERYGVGSRKAKFIARQETKLMVTAYKQERYEDAGITSYKWQTVAGSAKHPVRKDHKRLDGKTFNWDNPPITDQKTKRRNHPGQDYNCRCVARPIVKF